MCIYREREILRERYTHVYLYIYICIFIIAMTFASMSCDIHTHTPAKSISAHFRLYTFLLRKCVTNCIGHGHGYEWHSSI